MAGFRYLFLASSLWYFGRWMETVVLGWLVLQLTNSPFHVAMIAFFRNGPAFFLAIFAGPLADRLSRRRLLIGTQMVNCGVSIGMLTLVGLGLIEYWQIALATLVMGISWALDWPTRRAFQMDVVGPKIIHSSIVLDTVASNLSRIIGPLTGGGLIVLISVTGCYWLLTVTYAISILSIWLVPRVKEVRAAREPLRQSLNAGMRYTRRSQVMLGVLFSTVIMNVGIFQYQQILSVFARDVLKVGPALLGLLAAADGIGSLIGTIILGFGLRDRRRGLVFIAGATTQAIFIFCFAGSSWFVVSFGLLILAGIAHTGFTAYQTLIPLVTAPPDMRGRMMALVALAIGTTPIGAFSLGALANATSASVAVAVLAGLSVVGLAAVWVRLPGLRQV